MLWYYTRSILFSRRSSIDSKTKTNLNSVQILDSDSFRLFSIFRKTNSVWVYQYFIAFYFSIKFDDMWNLAPTFAPKNRTITPQYKNIYANKVRQILSSWLAESDFRHFSKYLSEPLKHLLITLDKNSFSPTHRIAIERLELFFTNRIYSTIDQYYFVIGYIYIPQFETYEPRIFYTPNTWGIWKVSPYILNYWFETWAKMGLDYEHGMTVAPHLQQAFTKLQLWCFNENICYLFSSIGFRKYIRNNSSYSLEQLKKVKKLGWDENKAFDQQNQLHYSSHYIESLQAFDTLPPIKDYEYAIHFRKDDPNFDINEYFRNHPIPKEILDSLTRTNATGFFEHPVLWKYFTEYFECNYQNHKIRFWLSYAHSDSTLYWISGLEVIDTLFNSYWVRSLQLNWGLLTTPPVEYVKILPQKVLGTQGKYTSIEYRDIRTHLQENPLIKACLEVQSKG